MDTANDLRILVAEDAIRRLENIIRNRRLNLPINWNRAYKLIHEAKSLILRIKYMFLPYRELASTSEITRLKELSIELAKLLLDKENLRRYKPDRFIVAETRYALRIFYGLKNRILLGDDNNPLYAIDIEGVEIVNVVKHPRSDKLWLTKAEGILPYDIVTNIQNIKKGEIRAAAILPPIELLGVLSEAMYCSDPLPSEYKGKRPPERYIDVKEVASKIYNIVGRRY